MTTHNPRLQQAAAALWAVLRRPETQAAAYLSQPRGVRQILREIVIPWAAVRAVATLVHSGFSGTLGPGIILASADWALGIGVWLGMSLALPAVVRSFNLHLPPHQAHVVATLLCAPLWLAGALYLASGESLFSHVTVRLMVLVVAAYGLVILRHALPLLHVPEPARLPVLTTVGTVYLIIYLGCFTALGIATNIILFIFGLGT